MKSFLEKFKIKITISDKHKWWLCLYGKYLLVVLAFLLYSLILARAQFSRAEKIYKIQLQQYIEASEMEAQLRAEAESNRPLSEQEILQSEAEEIAKVLYGVRNNSIEDLKTLCWCIFNRCDHPNYPGTVMDVITQPSQWMGYHADNPVLEDLYQIAYDELIAWTDGGHRPVSNEYIFMSWTPREIMLRDDFNAGSGTRYWRYK